MADYLCPVCNGRLKGVPRCNDGVNLKDFTAGERRVRCEACRLEFWIVQFYAPITDHMGRDAIDWERAVRMARWIIQIDERLGQIKGQLSKEKEVEE